MSSARLSIHPAFAIGEVDRRVFGSFVEHLGRAVYSGIYEPGHPTADAEGWRGDVAELTRELGTTVVRYPGGNFVSNYRWEDGVGPRDQRPTRIDLAWRTIEPNAVGTDDFMRWCRLTGTEPMMAVNLGTRGAAEAADLVEYCNIDGGTTLSELRRANGADEPHGIRLWCLGNEMDGPWQIGHKSADDYGRLASQAAQAMRRVDPSIELVACGSSARDMATFGEWERVVLEHTFDDVEYISVHAYYQERDGDRASFLASGASFEAFLHEVIATADAVAAKRHSTKRIKLSVDEWNVWYIDDFAGETNLELLERPRLIEDVYSALDAVVVADLLTTLVRNADRVGVACLAQLVNVIAPIMTEPGGDAWRQTTFAPIALLARHARGTALDARLDSPRLATAKHGEVEALSAAVVWNSDESELVLSVTNRSTEPVATTLDHLGFADVALVDALTLLADDHGPRRTAAEVAEAAPRVLDDVHVGDGSTQVTLPPESWSLVRLRART
ncbi:alpha-N-arabinofuranosidase [Microcella sp.]|uniref:arabinosylfuranosidase ArfA n=1 Tax=Microcella sp. TaxID=1913979 RepID=UPI002568EB53|nr:alpha-N-arabinofuranosidase [Microcella sp.]MBX9472492.1 alpha-N-arabinofuranosidase [Microcella sp.]